MNRFNCSILTIFALIALVGCGAIDNQISTNAVNSSYETVSSVSGSIVSGGSVSCDDSKKVLVDRNVPRSAIKFAKSIYKKLVTDYHEDEKKGFPDFQKNKSLAKYFTLEKPFRICRNGAGESYLFPVKWKGVIDDFMTIYKEDGKFLWQYSGSWFPEPFREIDKKGYLDEVVVYEDQGIWLAKTKEKVYNNIAPVIE